MNGSFFEPELSIEFESQIWESNYRETEKLQKMGQVCR